MKTILKIFFVIIFLADFANSQVVGVIYSKTEANQKFGSIVNSVEITTAKLNDLLNQAGNYLLFKINDKNLYILDEGRKPLYPEGISVAPEEVLKIVSVSKIQELLNNGQNEQTFFEERNDVNTITNGEYTLEEIANCPPFCN
jgi:hypothetical protein